MEDIAQLKPKLSRLKLSGVLETLDERTKQAMSGKWSPSQFLLTLMTDEVERRNNAQLNRNLVRSGLDPAVARIIILPFTHGLHNATLPKVSMVTCR